MAETGGGAPTADGLFQQAVSQHQAGRLQEAEKHYRAALAIDPRHPDANHNLGAMALQMKQPAGGLPFLKTALETNLKHPQYWISYIFALIQTGQTDLARDTLRRARAAGITADPLDRFENQLDPLPAMQRAAAAAPDSAEAHSNLGAALKAAGRLDEALASYHRAITLKPDLAEAHGNLGNALQGAGRHEEALASLRRALEIKPGLASAHNNLGIVLQAMGRLDEAIESLGRAAALNPDFAEAQNNLGNALQALGRAGEAEAAFRRALALNPGLTEAQANLGNALQAQGKVEEAAQALRAAVAARSGFAPAHLNLGSALLRLGRPHEAEASFRRAIEIDPGLAEAHGGLGHALHTLGRLEAAVVSLRRAVELEPASAAARSSLIFTLNCLPGVPVETLMAEARAFGKLAAARARPALIPPAGGAPDRPLRLGLLSSDLRNHPVGYFVEGLLNGLAAERPGRVDTVVYANHGGGDAVTGQIKAACALWRPVLNLSDEALAAQVREDRIDVLIDLGGHTAHNRLTAMAWRCAPVQAHWLGYFATTGVEAIDYFIADVWTAPADEDARFTEKLWRLPETCLCMAPPPAAPAVGPLPALAAGHVTFGCFNNLSKIDDAVIALWARVLKKVPGSRLLLKTKALGEAQTRAEVLQHFVGHGITAGRLELEGASPRADYLAAYNRVDIGLDPFPYPGGTTSVESLWMGTPVLTRAGDRLLSRLGTSIAHNAGLADWVAADDDAYVEKAAAFAQDLTALAALRTRLSKQVMASPLYDARRFAGHFEDMLRAMLARAA